MAACEAKSRAFGLVALTLSLTHVVVLVVLVVTRGLTWSLGDVVNETRCLQGDRVRIWPGLGPGPQRLCLGLGLGLRDSIEGRVGVRERTDATFRVRVRIGMVKAMVVYCE